MRFLLVTGRLVPVAVLRAVSEDGLQLAHPAALVWASPARDPAPEALPEALAAQVYAHYGYTPHWEAGNIFTGHPD